MKPETSETIKAFFGTLGFLFVLLPIFFIGIPFIIISAPDHFHLFGIGMYRYLGLLPIAVGASIYFWCSYHFVFSGKGTPIVSVPPKELVVKGLYRFVRNPMYLGGFSVLLGETLLFQSRGVLFYFLFFIGYINIMLMAVEEPKLRKRFGEHYEQYCKSVRRWIPRLTAYHKNDST